MIDEMRANELRPQIAALEQTVTAYPKIIETYRQARESAIKQQSALQSWLRLGEGEDLSAAISNKTQSAAAIIEATRETYIRRRNNGALRANLDGTVARILIWPGNIVAAGTPIMNIVDDKPRNVIGFLPEVRPVNLKAGQEVLVWRQNEPSLLLPGGQKSAVTAVVSSISPNVEALPVRINPLQVQVQGGQPIRGRRILFKLQGAHDFSPGKTVEIGQIHAGWRAGLDRLMTMLTGHNSQAPRAAEPKSRTNGTVRY